MKRLLLAAALSVWALAADAQTQTEGVSLTFVAVDAVHPRGSYLWFTGIVEDAAAAAEQRLYLESTDVRARCERFALLAMSKPGQYALSFYGYRYVGQTVVYWQDCKLARAVP